jgi:Ca2+-binding RTX toxin-like protein
MATFLASNWSPSTPENDVFVMDGSNWRVDAVKSYGFSSPDNNTLRFELRKGDRFSDNAWTDPSGVERVEVLNTKYYQDGTPISLKYQFMIEPGPVNTAKWAILGQMHADLNKSPPFELALRGNDKVQFIVRSDAGEKVVYSMPANLTRGKWYDVQVDARFDAGGKGTLDVWLDGQHVVDYSGSFGYSAQTSSYWREGIYRATPSGGETLAVNYKNLDMEAALKGYVPPSGAPAPTPTPTPSDGTITGTAGKEKITGTSGKDTINALDGGDWLIGKEGNDILTGGSGGDVFSFDTNPGTGNVDIITDFSSRDDTIYLENAIFTKLATGPLGSASFRVGTKALDSNDYIVYNRETGAVYYDADGSGAGAAVQFATLSNKTGLIAGDFYIV